MTRTARLQCILLAGILLLAGIGTGRLVDSAQAAVSRTDSGVRFTYSDAGATSVAWAGDYNGWNLTANPMVRSTDGTWSVVLPLPAGDHAYKFVVDNNWIADPDNPRTQGEFGNSVVTVNADGSLVADPGSAAGAVAGRDARPARGAGEVRGNTPYSAKLEFHGRGIGLYESFLSRDNDRFELRRPRMDFDLETAIRISDVLTGRWLMKINAEEEALDFFRTRLTFDRGNLTFRKNDIEIFAYDNEAAGTWDDPLHLVGDVGIYGYDYGYERHGFRVRPRIGGFTGELHYADNFRIGGTTYPPFVPADIEAAARTLPVVDGAAGFRFPAGAFASGTTVTVSDANEDILALRLLRDVGPFTGGLLGRMDRGFDLGSGGYVVAEGPDRLRAIGGTFEQLWYGYGGEARWRPGAAGLELVAEALAGRRVADFLAGAQSLTFQATFDDTGAVTAVTQVSTEDASNRSVVLDRSRRLATGARWLGHWLGAGAGLSATIAYQDHDDRPSLEGLRATDRGRRSMRSVRARWDQAWSGLLPRAVATIVDVEWQGFDYRADDPWDAQFWFSSGNFWLEHLGDRVSPDRIVMLGGRDVWTFRPELRVPLLPARNCALEYAGRIHTHSLSTRPKFVESFFRLGYDLTPSLRAQTDTRWAKYDDPTLGLYSGYVDHFVELAYTFTTGIQVALSYGVDPWALDRATNAYAYRGRDDALAAAGVGSAGARTAFLDQGPVIAAAERSMRDERRIAVEAIVRF